MTESNQGIVELVVSKLGNSKDLLSRFLESPMAVVAELTGGPVDQATLEAIGERLRERFSGELTESEMAQAVGGALLSRLQTLKPLIGPIGGFSSTISAV